MNREDILKEVGERLKNGEEILSIKSDLSSRGLNLDDISYNITEEDKKPKYIKTILIPLGIILFLIGILPYSLSKYPLVEYFKSFDNYLPTMLGLHTFDFLGIIVIYIGIKIKK